MNKRFIFIALLSGLCVTQTKTFVMLTSFKNTIKNITSIMQRYLISQKHTKKEDSKKTKNPYLNPNGIDPNPKVLFHKKVLRYKLEKADTLKGWKKFKKYFKEHPKIAENLEQYGVLSKALAYKDFGFIEKFLVEHGDKLSTSDEKQFIDQAIEEIKRIKGETNQITYIN